jgi:HAD superfamily hydrolase (TIGR01662 family)
LAIRAVFFDLDFTLWRIAAPYRAPDTDGWPWTEDLKELVRTRQVRRLGELLGSNPLTSNMKTSADLEAALVEALGSLWSEFGSDSLREIDGPDRFEKVLAGMGCVMKPAHTSALWDAGYICYPDFPIELYDDTLSTLEKLKNRGLRIAILTNSPWLARVRRPDLAALGIGAFVDAFFASADAGYRKPHPLIFERALAALGVTPAEAVMVGDELAADVAGARNAGLTGIWKRNGRSREQPEEVDFVIDGLHELFQLGIF